MTVGSKMHEALTSLEGAKSTLETFSYDTDDKQAKQMFTQYAQQLDSICQGLSQRVNYIEQQEPQYKVKQNQAQPQQQQQKKNQ